VLEMFESGELAQTLGVEQAGNAAVAGAGGPESGGAAPLSIENRLN
jgi:hypothetical protein